MKGTLMQAVPMGTTVAIYLRTRGEHYKQAVISKQNFLTFLKANRNPTGLQVEIKDYNIKVIE